MAAIVLFSDEMIVLSPFRPCPAGIIVDLRAIKNT